MERKMGVSRWVSNWFFPTQDNFKEIDHLSVKILCLGMLKNGIKGIGKMFGRKLKEMEPK